MLNQFRTYLQEQALWASGERLLLGISGGADSVVLAELCYRCQIPFGIAHVNFQLRGDESDADEAFVKQQAERWNVPFYVQHFGAEITNRPAQTSVQMAARDLRYAWFESLANTEGFDSIAVGTHLDDSIETFFINLGRGTGLHGLTGIQAKRGRLIRPLLFATAKQIRQFAADEQIPYRNDSSNASKTYLRNRIRQEVIPALSSVFPDFRETMLSNLGHLSSSEALFNQQLEVLQVTVGFRETATNQFELPISTLLEQPEARTILHAWLSPLGFPTQVVYSLFDNLNKQSGTRFIGDRHIATLDRDRILITPKETEVQESFTISRDTQSDASMPLPLSFESCPVSECQIVPDPKQAFLDLDKLQFPLVLRPWSAGDSFVPLGMTGRKKISDFLVDQKVPLPEKPSVYVLESAGEIAWVVGYRIAEGFKVGDQTKNSYIARLTS